MTRDERLELLRAIIDALGAMGYVRSVRSVIRDLAAEHGAVQHEPSARPEAWERALSEFELAEAQRKGAQEAA